MLQRRAAGWDTVQHVATRGGRLGHSATCFTRRSRCAAWRGSVGHSSRNSTRGCSTRYHTQRTAQPRGFLGWSPQCAQLQILRTHTRSRRRCGRGEPVPAQMWHGASPVPAQVRQGRAQSRRRCGRGEPSPGADVGRGEPSRGADVAGASPVPAQTWQRAEQSARGCMIGLGTGVGLCLGIPCPCAHAAEL